MTSLNVDASLLLLTTDLIVSQEGAIYVPLVRKYAGVIGDWYRAGDWFLRNQSPGYLPADLFRIRRFVPLVTASDRFRPGDSVRICL